MIEWDPAGGGPASPVLVVGGSFPVGATGYSIASWDGTAWHQFGATFTSSTIIEALTTYNGELIAAGHDLFIAGVPTNIARWDGAAWHPLGPGQNGTIHALTTFNGELIAAGYFQSVGGVSANNIARWNGTIWRSLGSGVGSASQSVGQLVVYNHQLVAVGSFNVAGGLPANTLASWNGLSWQAIPGVAGASCATLYNGNLLVAGNVFTGASASLYGIATWDGITMQALPGDTGGQPRSLSVYQDQIVAGGVFYFNGYQHSVIQRSGASWQPLAPTPPGTANVTLVRGGEVIVGGDFQTAAGYQSRFVAHWHGPTTCRADFDCSYSLTVQDIFDFLNAWFAGDPRADFNGGGLSVQGIFDFLAAWFAGC